jgi:hypothetical protein
MRLWYAVLLAIALASLFTAQPQSAHACTCLGLDGSVETARAYIGFSDAVVVGYIEESHIDIGGSTAAIRTERICKGSVPERFSVTSGSCNGLFAEFRDGERWIMHLSRHNDQWSAHGCGAMTAASAEGVAYLAVVDDALDTAGPMWPVIFALGGFGAGAGLALVIWRIVRKRDFAAP